MSTAADDERDAAARLDLVEDDRRLERELAELLLLQLRQYLYFYTSKASKLEDARRL